MTRPKTAAEAEAERPKSSSDLRAQARRWLNDLVVNGERASSMMPLATQVESVVDQRRLKATCTPKAKGA
jgi:hypothetical protein